MQMLYTGHCMTPLSRLQALLSQPDGNFCLKPGRMWGSAHHACALLCSYAPQPSNQDHQIVKTANTDIVFGSDGTATAKSSRLAFCSLAPRTGHASHP